MKTKKLLKNLILLSFVFLSNVALATGKCATVFCGGEDGLTAVKNNLPKNIIGSKRLAEVLMGYVSFFLPYAGVFAFVAIIYAGFLYITSAANEKGADEAKKILINIALGIILILMSYSIVTFFIDFTK